MDDRRRGWIRKGGQNHDQETEEIQQKLQREAESIILFPVGFREEGKDEAVKAEAEGGSMKLEIGWMVYYITEKFKPYGFHIAKCEVKKVPMRKGHKEYCLIEKPWNKPLKMYWVPAKNIHLTYEEAVTAAEEMADKYDKTWGWMETCHREWRD